MEDYYKLLGVQPDDARETIRDAYRVKKAELDAQGSDAARAHASRLNRAWNVLSDDAQRGRYDDQLAEARAEGNVEDSPEFEIVDAPPARGRGRQRQPRQLIPQETEINGVPLASNKDRGIAFAIDALILVVLLFVAQGLTKTVAEGMQADDYKAWDAQRVVTEEAADTADAREEKLDDAQQELDDAETAKAPQDEIDALTDQRDEAKRERDAAKDDFEAQQDKLTDLGGELAPTLRVLAAGWTVVALAITVVPTALGGRTLGKRLRGIAVLREDGSPAGWVGAVKHFGIPVGSCGLVAIVLGLPYIQIAGLVWMFGITSFARNPRRQGWHDRLAKTIVAQG